MCCSMMGLEVQSAHLGGAMCGDIKQQCVDVEVQPCRPGLGPHATSAKLALKATRAVLIVDF